MRLKILVLCFVLSFPFLSHSQGGSCGSPIPLTLDGVSRSYTTSASTGGNVICANAGNTPITFFSFTSNVSGQCVLLNIAGPNGQPVEVAMYAGGSCSNGNLQSSSGMCFDDGTGLWAPSETFTITPLTTYILRIKTAIAGTMEIAGQYITPSNDDCFGAMPIGTDAVADNNACTKGGPGVVPSQLCAFTLENTSFYSYTVASTGTTSVYIENITCDNGNANNSNGFQIGFFTGTCSALTGIGCASNSGTTVIANTGILPAGTRVFVGVDGVNGANCSYTLRATNVEPLPIRLKNFSGWKTTAANILKWTTLHELNNLFFEIQRSVDGMHFESIGRVPGALESDEEKNYFFEDNNPPAKAFYRLMQTDIDGATTLSRVVMINREGMPEIKFEFANPVTEISPIGFKTNFSGIVEIAITNIQGHVIYNGKLNCIDGYNRINKNMAGMPDGKYILTLVYKHSKISKSFIKVKASG